MYFALGFVLLPTIALTSPMLDEILNYPADTTGYMAIPRSVALVGALILAGRIPAQIDNRLVVVGGMSLIVYANWRMLGYSPLMDWRPVLVAGVIQGAGLGILMQALTKAAFSTLDPTLRPEGATLFNLSRLYGSTIGIALVIFFFYDNTQAMHLALAKDLTPYRSAAHVAGSIAAAKLASRHLDALAAAKLAMLNDLDYGPGGLRRGDRPIRGDDDRDVDREPARAVFEEATTHQLTFMELRNGRVRSP